MVVEREITISELLALGNEGASLLELAAKSHLPLKTLDVTLNIGDQPVTTHLVHFGGSGHFLSRTKSANGRIESGPGLGKGNTLSAALHKLFMWVAEPNSVFTIVRPGVHDREKLPSIKYQQDGFTRTEPILNC